MKTGFYTEFPVLYWHSFACPVPPIICFVSKIYVAFTLSGTDSLFVYLSDAKVLHWVSYLILTQNKSQHTRLTVEKKMLPPLLPGFELATFRSRVRWATNKLSHRLTWIWQCVLQTTLVICSVWLIFVGFTLSGSDSFSLFVWVTPGFYSKFFLYRSSVTSLVSLINTTFTQCVTDNIIFICFVSLITSL